MTKWYTAQVNEVIQLTPTTRQFQLAVRDTERFTFQAGQFITLDLPIGEKRRDRWRSYSIASPPGHGNILELCIVRSTQGAGTKYLFEEVGPGSTVTFKGPEGSFTLPTATDSDLVFVCTGTGIAPFRSMLHSMEQQTEAKASTHLIMGCRTRDELLYASEWEAMAKINTSFRWDVALSRESTQGFYSGYVHNVYESFYPLPAPNRHFYLCGWRPMIDEAMQRLQTLGYPPSQIHYELYG